MGASAYVYSSESYKTEDYAARLCSILEFNGYDDWFLPSLDELDLMYNNLHQEERFGFLDSSYYWSSSEFSGKLAFCYGHGKWESFERERKWPIRPCKSF